MSPVQFGQSLQKHINKRISVPAKMAQWVKVLTYKPDNLSLIPKTHTVEGREPTLTTCPLTYSCELRHAYCPRSDINRQMPLFI